MPHVVIKLRAGRSDPQKSRLAELVAAAVVTGAGCGEEAVSVSIEDVEAGDWVEKIYKPEIIGKPRQLYRRPGYDPL